ncbi:carbamoyltransferase HypF [Sulfurospirillum diekertiae]|uniref:Carbamoyltransferase n=1 Tax=Sulfurospirillum diekertiae TaxID=1854492 RepID=A0A6G9VW38_9BACT|nr:carbamoyltransferase HypF [Sulfurospirillum diekertiae]QIR77151.1 carbamoyltransferase HypF [Sulfurospirillum diekertiae]QIR79766.1 carbamoyltransferase HypF [Sulfurospirillum diekertiae]
MISKSRLIYHIEGIVQGVGFRPFVYTLALRFHLKGFVLNNSKGVIIEIEGFEESLDSFEQALFKELPPLARIDFWQKNRLTCKNDTRFEIRQSDEASTKSSLVLPDMSICDDCLKELYDPNNRRYHYFFINCTHCGPRYSIIKTVPYDRPYTSMQPFVMCEACQSEYTNPLDRRYHAQPISCPTCGPTLSLCSINGELLATNEAAIVKLADLINVGHIVALKGMGGFHLICDATSDRVLASLRERKHRPSKPFAVMFKTIEAIKEECILSAQEEEGICSLLRPIVLVKRNVKASKISGLIAPRIDRLGVFLPYTPLHVMLFEYLKNPIVATSANRSGEPIISEVTVLKQKLHDVVEYYLDYNREIVNSSDDSVLQYLGDKTLLMRSSRGIAPKSFRVDSSDERKILAVGAHQKNAIAIYLNHQIIVSPYIGDLDNIASNDLFEKMIERFSRFYDFTPDLIVGDLHPNYVSTQWVKRQNIPFVQVQHHYAHILSAMCEHKLSGKVLGIAWDGTGYGDDGTIWGGEFLVCDPSGYERVCFFEPFPLLGADASIKEIKRILASLLWDVLGDEADALLLDYFDEKALKRLKQIYTKKINSPLCSSVGRLFDAVAVLCGMEGNVSYDGESGLLIEALYDPAITDRYTFEIDDKMIRYKPMFAQMLHDKEPHLIASKFINTLVEMALTISHRYTYPIVLGGGVFQNRTLMEQILQNVTQPLYFPLQLAINDGGICVGQIYKSLQK